MRKLLAVIGAWALLMGSGVAIADDGADGRQDVPDNAVAIVDGDPIAKAEYDRWFEINTRLTHANGDKPRDRQLMQQTMALLIQGDWIEKEAAALGIEVSKAQVGRSLRKTRRESFGNDERAYKRFLRESGLTEADMRWRVRIQELSTAITRHVQRGAAGKEKTKRIKAFAREFQKRWTEQTECRSGFVIPICGNAA